MSIKHFVNNNTDSNRKLKHEQRQMKNVSNKGKHQAKPTENDFAKK